MRINIDIYKWIVANGYPVDYHIKDILLSNWQTYHQSHAPLVIDVWQWLWSHDCFIDVRSTCMTDEQGIINPVAVAEYHTTADFFRETSTSIEQSLLLVMTDMATCYNKNDLIHADAPKK